MAPHDPREFIPGNLLTKKRRLNEQETEMVRKHLFLGSKMLD